MSNHTKTLDRLDDQLADAPSAPHWAARTDYCLTEDECKTIREQAGDLMTILAQNKAIGQGDTAASYCTANNAALLYMAQAEGMMKRDHKVGMLMANAAYDIITAMSAREAMLYTCTEVEAAMWTRKHDARMARGLTRLLAIITTANEVIPGQGNISTWHWRLRRARFDCFFRLSASQRADGLEVHPSLETL